jgi:hypothetical protein
MKRRLGQAPFVAVLAFVLLAGAGCVRTITDFTIVSTKNVDLSRMGEYERDSRVRRGRDVVHWVTIFPLSWTGEPELKPAIDRAIMSVPGGVALLDGRIRESYWYIPLLYGQHALIVEGTPLIDPKVRGK